MIGAWGTRCQPRSLHAISGFGHVALGLVCPETAFAVGCFALFLTTLERRSVRGV